MRYNCPECGWIGQESEVKIVKLGDVGMDVWVCPNCHRAEVEEAIAVRSKLVTEVSAGRTATSLTGPN
jgi:predicted RNA-binding Zn-ribbon protein involved in translation (DUF1610 family)